MIAGLRAKLAGIQKHSEEVRATILGLQESIERGSVKEMHQHIADLQAQTERLGVSIGHFRLHPNQEREEDQSVPAVVSAATSEDSVRLPRA